MKNNPLILLIAASLLLRLALITFGVQDAPDEFRYLRAVSLLNTHDFSAILTMYDHVGFTVISIIPAAFHKLLAQFTGMSLESLYTIPALFFSLASVGCIALVYGIARRTGASQRESFLAAFLLALTNSLFYFSSFLLPYDAGLCGALLTLYVGLKPNPSYRRSVMVGLLACCAFLTYNANWVICVTVLVIHALNGRQRVFRGMVAGLGFVLPLFGLALATRGEYLVGLLVFSGTVTQGAFSEGWSLPFEWMWYAERLFLLIWLIGALFALIVSARRIERRVLIWLLACGGIYAALVAGSVVLERFVVYGRTARQLVPFIVLIAAYGVDQLPCLPRRLFVIVAVFVAIPNLILPFMIATRWGTEQRARAEVGAFARDFTLTGSNWKPDGSGRYVLLNTQWIYPVTGVMPPPAGSVIFSVNHPYRFDPLLYEGLDPQMRAIVRSVNLQMTLIDTESRNSESAPPYDRSLASVRSK